MPIANNESVNPMWTPPRYPEGAERVELIISGEPDIVDYLHGLIKDIENPFNTFQIEDYLTCIYTSQVVAERVIEKLYQALCGLHPGLIGHPDGLTKEDDVLIFKESEVFVG